MEKLFSDLVLPGEQRPKFTFISGKGGVGKSSIAAATAVWVSDKKLNTLIVSTDLQKSLNDIFQQNIKFSETKIKPYLNAVSIETAETLAYHKGDIIKTLEVIDSKSPVLKQIREEMKSACGCEIASLFVFTEYLNNKTYDAVVFDTAPTGHTLEDLTNQINYTLNLTKQIEAEQKLKSVFNKAEFNKRMEGLKKYEMQQKNAIKNLQSDRTSFLMTILPEGLPIFEAERSIKALEDVYNIPVRGVLINEVLPESERYTTTFWKNRWEMQNKYINQARQKFKGKLIAEVPLLDGEIIGLEKIRKIGEVIYG